MRLKVFKTKGLNRIPLNLGIATNMRLFNSEEPMIYLFKSLFSKGLC